MKEQLYTTQFLFHNKISYVVVPKVYLKDKNLSLKAKGLLSIIYSLPEDWDYSVKGLISISGSGEKQITNTLNELIEKNYIRRMEDRNKNGTFKYIYLIFTEPTEWY